MCMGGTASRHAGKRARYVAQHGRVQRGCTKHRGSGGVQAYMAFRTVVQASDLYTSIQSTQTGVNTTVCLQL